MSDNLRDRIAYAIAQADGDEPGMEPASCDYELADAVIRELGLRAERADKQQPLHGCADPDKYHRYVTDWTADE